MIATFSLSTLRRGTCQTLAVQSREVETLASPTEARQSSFRGSGYASFLATFLSRRKSTQMRALPLFFGKMATGLAHALWLGYLTLSFSILLIGSTMICRLEGPVRYGWAQMGTASGGVTMACWVAWIVPMVTSHKVECVRSISRLFLCKCSGAALRSTSSIGSSVAESF